MKTYILITLLICNLLKAEDNNSLIISKKDVTSLSKKSIVYFLKIKKHDLFLYKKNKLDKLVDKKSIPINSLVRMSSTILQYEYPFLTVQNFNRQVIIYSKKDEISKDFAQELKKLNFKHVSYLQGGNKSYKEIIYNFRGIKLFSIFTK